MPSFISIQETSARSASIDQDFVRSYERTFVIVTDQYTTDPAWIFEELGNAYGLFVQQYYQTTSETDLKAIINSITLRQDPGDQYGYIWIATIPYGPWDPYKHATSPLLVYPRVTIEGFNGTRLCERDYLGNPLLNTAYDPYDHDVPEMDEARINIRIQQNLSTFSPATVLFYSNKINSDTWFGLAPHTCKIDPPRASVAYHQACGQYWETEFNIVVNPNYQVDPSTDNTVIIGWDSAIPSRGYRQLISGNWQTILNHDGTPLEQPTYLNGSGVALTPPVSPSDIVTTVWQKYVDIDFTSTFRFATAGAGALFF